MYLMKKIINKKTLLLLSLLLFLPLFSGCFLTPSVNQTPTIISTPITTARVAVAYAYTVIATDPDEDTLTYSLTVNPTGMTIDPTTGVISWTPTSIQSGDHSVTVAVSDGSLSATQSFIIIVSKATIIHPPTPIVVPVADKEITAAKAIANVAVVTGDVQTLAGIKTTLGDTVILLVAAGEVTVPVTWSATTTPGYDNAAAATYVLTGTIGTLPAGYVDEVETIATVTVNIVVTTPERYFTFDIPTKTITDYDVAGGLNVVIPSTIAGVAVTSIGDGVFFDDLLISVTIPDSVTSIGDNAFYTNNLHTVTIPDSVTYIGSFAFANNYLDTITIPNSVTSISDGAFANNHLDTVTIPDSVTSIGNNAFSSNKLTSVIIPNILNGVTSIGNYAFNNNLLTSVTIPDSVTSIDAYAFAGNLLTSVTIGNHVTSIGVSAFGGSPIVLVTIGASVGTGIDSATNTMGTNSGFKAAYEGGGAGTYDYEDIGGGTLAWDKRL